MRVKFSRQFTKQYAKTGSKVRKSFDKRLKLFLQDPFDPILNNHKLSGRLKSYGSINVTGDWRAIYYEDEIKDGEPVVTFLALGTHSDLYK